MLIGAAVLGIANAIVKPILTLLALPLILLTLGLAYFAINVLMLAIAEWVAPDFSIDGFWTYIGATIVVWLVNWILSSALATLFGGREAPRRRLARRVRTHERPRPADRRGRPSTDPNVVGVLLKGSQSMGAADEESDWDVVLVLLEGEPSQKRDGSVELITTTLERVRRASRRGSCRRSRTLASCWTRRASSPSRSRPPAA